MSVAVELKLFWDALQQLGQTRGDSAMAAVASAQLTPAEVTVRARLEEIYARGMTRACNFGLGAAELQYLSTPEHGGLNAAVYGDSDVEQVLHLFRLLTRRAAGKGDVFVDLGSGSGRLVLLVHLLTPVAESVGVELSQTRHEAAQAAMAEAIASQLICDGEAACGRKVDLVCSSMLHYDLSDATMVFVYNLCFDDPFLQELEAKLLTQLPVGASVLVRGKAFPLREPTETSNSGRRLELQLRLMMFYGYRVVESRAGGAEPGGRGGARQGVAGILRPDLQSGSVQLGTTRFERSIFFDRSQAGAKGAAADEQRSLCVQAMAHGRTQWEFTNSMSGDER